MKTLDTNPYLESIRAAYRKSSMYAKIHNESAPQAHTDQSSVGVNPKPAAADLPLGIALDALEAELEERINA